MTTDILAELKTIVGQNNVLDQNEDRTAYDTDILGVYSEQSLAVVRPASTQEVAAVLKLAHDTGTAVVPQSGNTSLAGGATPTGDATQIILSLGRLNRITDINTKTRIARVEAGVVLENLHTAVEEQELIFPLMFGARGTALLGGALSTNAGGSNVVRYGNTRALVLGLEVVTPDGRVMNLMSELHKDNTGYDLKDLYIGAEGTLGVITGAVLKLFPKPSAYATAYLALKDMSSALELLQDLQYQTGGAVEAFEYLPDYYFEDYTTLYPDRRSPLPDPNPVNILVEVAASSALLSRSGENGRAVVHDILEETLSAFLEDEKITDAVIAQSDAQREAFWHCRESAYYVSTQFGAMIDHDVSVPLDHVATFLSEMTARLPAIASNYREYAIAHLGDGNLHYSVVPLGLDGPIPPETKIAITTLVEDVVSELDGSFSAEHGVGQSKRPSMARRKDPVALDIMRQVKSALDPQYIMNPGKVIPQA
ncbi:FAD-binding oxidoreductase [Cochlodiniinecator piscidefendens]|uniref:FAD-binding oxidoreductase n=1 Tax=Cochlodiniinecator piscidefendens TaxID=2715756 RepID=UPI00140C8236|nr:FAD-binding oxidoreductase [Cochlodiniinecator piscidefendens]